MVMEGLRIYRSINHQSWWKKARKNNDANIGGQTDGRTPFFAKPNFKFDH
jgi:hypothetical protein